MITAQELWSKTAEDVDLPLDNWLLSSVLQLLRASGERSWDTTKEVLFYANWSERDFMYSMRNRGFEVECMNHGEYYKINIPKT